MFPTLRVSFSGLDPTSNYVVLMDIVPVDKKRYRYAYHRSSWLVAGKADPPPKSQLYTHPDAAFVGEQLMKQTVSFEKVKLTNNTQDKNGQVCTFFRNSYVQANKFECSLFCFFYIKQLESGKKNRKENRPTRIDVK